MHLSCCFAVHLGYSRVLKRMGRRRSLNGGKWWFQPPVAIFVLTVLKVCFRKAHRHPSGSRCAFHPFFTPRVSYVPQYRWNRGGDRLAFLHTTPTVFTGIPCEENDQATFAPPFIVMTFAGGGGHGVIRDWRFGRSHRRTHQDEKEPVRLGRGKPERNILEW